MSGHKQIHKSPKANTNGFDKNPQNINRSGAHRKLVSSVNKELEDSGIKEATKAEITSCYMRLVNVPITELQQMIENDENPALVRIVAKNILSGKGFDIIEKMLDRAIGKPKEEIKNIVETKPFDLKQAVLNFMDEGDEETEEST